MPKCVKCGDYAYSDKYCNGCGDHFCSTCAKIVAKECKKCG